MRKKHGNRLQKRDGKRNRTGRRNGNRRQRRDGNKDWNRNGHGKRQREVRAGIIIALVVIVIVFAAIAWFSLSETVTDVTPGTPLPFTTNYAVSFPEGQTTTLGNSRINVMWFENELITDIDGAKQKLVVGEERVII